MKLRYLERWNAARRANANFYTEQLRGIVEAVPVVRPGSTPVYYLYIIRVGERAHFRRMLEREGIATGMHYPTPIHLQPA